MSEQPDLTAALEATKDPFLHGKGEEWDDIFKGEDQPFSRSFYAEQADEARRRCEADCACHLNPHDYVPVCPRHGLPLIAAEAGNGTCLWTGPAVNRRPWESETARCITWGPNSWEWKPRRMFNQADLPPHNGYIAPKPPSWMEPRAWGFATHDCPTCGETRHAVGDDRLVCLTCGLCRWTKDLA